MNNYNIENHMVVDEAWPEYETYHAIVTADVHIETTNEAFEKWADEYFLSNVRPLDDECVEFDCSIEIECEAEEDMRDLWVRKSVVEHEACKAVSAFDPDAYCEVKDYIY